MDFSDLIQVRQSVREYQDKPVEKVKLQKLIDAVRIAPSASNSQPWKLIIVDDPSLKESVAGATFNKVLSFNKFAVQAPVIAVLVIERPNIITRIAAHLKQREFPLIDIGIAAEHFCLQAADLDLGTCMLGWFDEKKIKELLDIPPKKRIGLVITLGYPVEGCKIREKARKKQGDMSSFNSWGGGI